jgi:hypothetical protein
MLLKVVEYHGVPTMSIDINHSKEKTIKFTQKPQVKIPLAPSSFGDLQNHRL